MELLEGQTLQEHLPQGALGWEKILDIGIQAAEALQAVHSKKIVHRDITPANLFLTFQGQIKILDFGLAKPAAGQQPTDTTPTAADAPITSTGTTVGTVAYMSPEQVRGQKLDARTDLFSFGVVLYEMATGIRPSRGPHPGWSSRPF